MTDKQNNNEKRYGISRRDFLTTAAGASATVVAPRILSAEAAKSGSNTLNIALIGAGDQGRGRLMIPCLKIPNVRFRAVCDIWEYPQKYAANILKKYKQSVNVYEDYREMLSKEKDLDAVIIATPDFVHAEQAIAAMEAGLHVYCEKEMSNSLEKAADMVRTAQKTKKLLQIGHQRRSNPRYLHALKMIEKDKILGDITHTFGQWNRTSLMERGWPEKFVIDEAKLEKYGYDSMFRFRNWRRFKKYSGGSIADLGSHQIDIFNWYLKTPPSTVQASAGKDRYEKIEWYDNIMAIYTWDTEAGPVRGFYQQLNTTSHDGYYETIMGNQGSLDISERPSFKSKIYREPTAKKRQWEDEAKKAESGAIELKVGETPDQDERAKEMVANLNKPVHQPHLENFFNTIRGKDKLNCPGEVGYETAVSVLKANKSQANGTIEKFKKEEFHV